MVSLEKYLASYAVKSAESLGRVFPEPEDSTRTVFQRDRDRIIHSKAFRRLSGKTQVFVATYGDHFRDRLTHSLEVAQVARDLCRSLGLNEDLAEGIALAHDLGHTPFGHAGEEALDEMMAGFGRSFEHNQQSKRIVELLERQFPHFDGLNLSHELRQGLAKHQTLYDQRTRKIIGKTLEAQVVDIADEIAYHNHDMDDGLRSGLFSFEDLERLIIWKKARLGAERRYGGPIKNPMVKRHRTVSMLVSLMIQNVLKSSRKNIEKSGVKNVDEVLKQKKDLIGFSADFMKQVTELRKFLWKNMYQSPQVVRHSERGQRIIRALFKHFYKKPTLMPRHFYATIDENSDSPRCVVVKDYVAGMTDQFATAIYKKL